MNDDRFDERVFDFLAQSLRPAVISRQLRNRMLSQLGGQARFLPFIDRMMTLFDVSESEASDHLQSIDRLDRWDEMLPGIRFRDFEGGPKLADAHGGMVRLLPGRAFPHHRHVGEEQVLILQGCLIDDEGRRYRAGDRIISADGTAHELRVWGDLEAIYAVAVTSIVFNDEDDEDDEDDEHEVRGSRVIRGGGRSTAG